MVLFNSLFSKNNARKTNRSHTVIYESKLPDYIDSANKIYNKQYDSAISDLKAQLKKAKSNELENISMIHINLMQAYFKNRSRDNEFFDLSIFHAKEALKYGHNTGLAAFRLIVNLEKKMKIKHAIEVCKLVTSKNYHFSRFGFKQKPEFIERLRKLSLKLEKLDDDSSELFFTDKEKEMIILNSNKNK